MSPPSVTARPATPWPPPRTAISAPRRGRGSPRRSTSAVDWHCAMSAGPLVDHAVVQPPGLVVAVGVGIEETAAEGGPHVVRDRYRHGGGHDYLLTSVVRAHGTTRCPRVTCECVESWASAVATLAASRLRESFTSSAQPSSIRTKLPTSSSCSKCSICSRTASTSPTVSKTRQRAVPELVDAEFPADGIVPDPQGTIDASGVLHAVVRHDRHP